VLPPAFTVRGAALGLQRETAREREREREKEGEREGERVSECGREGGWVGGWEGGREVVIQSVREGGREKARDRKQPAPASPKTPPAASLEYLLRTQGHICAHIGRHVSHGQKR
jgi:hypothetical protein